MSENTNKTTARGFNLVEAAIVLGVIGLVVGGIWVAASSLNYEMRMRQTVDGAAIMRENVKRIIGNTPGPYSISIVRGSLAELVTVGAAGHAMNAAQTFIVAPIGIGRNTPTVVTLTVNKGPPDLTLPSGRVVTSYISMSYVGRNITPNDCVRLTREMAARSRNFIEAVMRTVPVPDPQAILPTDCPAPGSALIYYFTE